MLCTWCAIFLLLASHASAEPWSAQIVDYGVYEVSRGASVENENVAAGLVVSYGKQLIKKTDQVEAILGTNFGFRYVLSGPDADVYVTIKVKHPTALKGPESGKEFTSSKWGQSVPVGVGNVNWNTGWIFEEDWEIVPGEWVMQLYVGEAKLLEKTFFIKDGRKDISKK